MAAFKFPFSAQYDGGSLLFVLLLESVTLPQEGGFFPMWSQWEESVLQQTVSIWP